MNEWKTLLCTRS